MKSAPALQPLLHVLALPACRNLASCILQYLAPEDLESLSEAGESSNSPNYFLTLARNLRFLSQFINRTDKSLYFTFFAEPQYRAIEAHQAAAVAQQAEPIFLILHQQCKAVLAMLMERVPAVEEEIQVLTNLLSDPDLPLPKLKRETQGMYCTSPFQLFLVDCTFRQDQQEYFCFEALRDSLSSEREEDYVRQFMTLLKERHGAGAVALRRVKQLRYTPYEVTAGNFKDFLLQDNELHNFIVGLFALTDVLVQATHAYISRISDPLQRLVQLLLRYSIFRNYVLAIEEYLAFAFKLYENIYHDAIEQDPRKPQFRFWRPALTKWFLRMDYLHQQGTQVYFHCLTRLRNAHLTAALAELAEQDQQRYGKLRNEVQLNDFENALGEKVYGAGMVTGSEVGLFFDQHPENYQMVVMEFNEYLVDVSVNEQTVHWCGHSAHQLEQPYLTYQSLLLDLNSQYTRSLLGNFPPADKHELVKIDAEYLSILQIKNRTLKALVGAANRQLGLAGQWAVGFDFEEADRKLQFFNAKALILSSVDEHERPFYSIPPLCSPDKLIDMLDTNDSSNNNTDQEIFQYLSDEEHEHTHKTKESREKETFEDWEEERTEGSMVLGRKPVGLRKVFAEDMEGPSSSSPLLRAKQPLEEL